MKKGAEKKERIKKFVKEEEKIWNIPNILTMSRIILTFVIIYLVIAGAKITAIVMVFAIAMITDFLDGQIARRFHMTTEFGRKLDMIADRFLLIGTVIAVVADFGIKGILERYELLQIFLIMSREIIAFPFALIYITSRMATPEVRLIGKLTTVLQAVTFPIILLSIYYPVFDFSIYLAVLTGIVGFSAGIAYITDIMIMESKTRKK